MRAAYIEQTGPPESIIVGDLPNPDPAPGEALVRIRAAALNPIDLYIRRRRDRHADVVPVHRGRATSPAPSRRSAATSPASRPETGSGARTRASSAGKG